MGYATPSDSQHPRKSASSGWPGKTPLLSPLKSAKVEFINRAKIMKVAMVAR
jgi:hypothetical protein